MSAVDQRSEALLHAAINEPREKLDAVVADANRWLADPAPKRRKTGLEVLGHVAAFRAYKLSADVLRNIADCAKDEAAIVRAETACTLSLVPHAPAAQRAELLLALLEDAEGAVREEAAAALGDLKLEAAREPLARRLSDESPRVKIEAAIALGALKDPRALETLLEILERPFDRIFACGALAELGDRRAVPALEKLASKFFLDFNERLHALGALYRLGDRAAGEKILERSRAWNKAERSVAVWMIGHAGVQEGLPSLFEMVRARGHKMRDAAIRGLGELDDPGAIGVLVELARDADEAIDVRLEAVAALSERRNDPRKKALEALAAAGGDQIADTARALLEDR